MELKTKPTENTTGGGSEKRQHGQNGQNTSGNLEIENLRFLESELGGAIKIHRVDRMTQEELARNLSQLLRAEIDQAAISRIESGARRITGPQLVAICMILELSFDKLVLAAYHLHEAKRQDPELLLKEILRSFGEDECV